MEDNSWLSERTKTIIVTVVMSILIIGMTWGYYAAYQWKAERGEFKRQNLLPTIEETNEQSREKFSDH